jgi:hypothetical protein
MDFGDLRGLDEDEMSDAAATMPMLGDIPPFPVRKFTVEEYHSMIEAGVFQSDEQCELLEGWIIRKMSKNPPHVVALKLLAQLVEKLLPAGWHIRTQDPITLEESEPEPDLTAVRGAIRDYEDRHPLPVDIGMLAEVADASLRLDRKEKKRVYARAGISIYWIVNLVDSQVEVYTEPSGPVPEPLYREQRIYGISDRIPLVIDGQEVGQLSVRDLLP